MKVDCVSYSGNNKCANKLIDRSMLGFGPRRCMVHHCSRSITCPHQEKAAKVDKWNEIEPGKSSVIPVGVSFSSVRLLSGMAAMQRSVFGTDSTAPNDAQKRQNDS